MEQKRRSFTCYFCNKLIKDDTEVGHSSVCAKVLLPCPNKCGAYVPRKELRKHGQDCLNRVEKSTLRRPSNNNPDAANISIISKLQNDLRLITSRMGDLEHVQNAMRKSRPVEMDLRQELEKLKHATRLIQEWKNLSDLKVDNLTQATRSCEQFRGERDRDWMSVQNKLMVIDRLQADTKILRDHFIREQVHNQKVTEEFALRFDEFQDVAKEDNAAISALWSDQKMITEDIRKDCTEYRKVVEDIKAKLTNVIFDTKTVSQIASEAADRIEIVERDFNTVRKQVEQIKLDLEILENLASASTITGSAGHLLWRISEFDSKLTTAKELGGVLKSPIFYSHEFGYRIRILVHLNGLKKWKDRYALISIHVLQGEYDALLKWPCRIEGTITVRDQENLDNPTDFSKFISAKRQCGDDETEEPQESSSSYIFVPHSTLISSKYLKDDTIYLEARINNNRAKRTETSL